MAEDEYEITANISRFEFKVLQHVRSLKAYGWGSLHIDVENGVAVSCKRTSSDDPKSLKQLQSTEGR